jgi:hypothetical protein
MNYQEPLHTSHIDFSKIVYPKTRANQNKKIVLVKYNEKGKLKNFVFQTPTLLNLTKPNFANGYAEVEVALMGKEKTKVSKFIRFLNDLENKVKSDAQFNASSWFNIDDDNQTINFQKIIRESDDYTNGTIKIKIIKNNEFETMVQLNNNKRIGIDAIPEDSWCKMILECYAVWINANNDFGLFFRPVLCSFTPREKEIYNYKFLEDSDEENENAFEIPDTEINNNIFMKIDPRNKSKLKMKTNDSTSQLDLQELVNQLESEDNEQPNTSDIKLSIINVSTVKPDDNVVNINIQSGKFSESTSSDSESESEYESSSSNESSNNRLVDAETSDN